MKDFALILIGTTLVNNFVLVKFLGVCPFVGASRRVETAVGMGLATTFVLTLTGALAWVLETYLLAPLDIEYLRILAFLLVIAGVAQLAERVMAEASPVLYQLLGIFLPLITINCAVLGVALLNQQEKRTFLESTLYGFGAGLGFSLVLILFAAIRERVDAADVPAPFRGAAITFITLGLMSLAFMGFAGRAPS
jgi:electron transport complex protein RnfA